MCFSSLTLHFCQLAHPRGHSGWEMAPAITADQGPELGS